MSRWWRKTVSATELSSGSVTTAKIAAAAVTTAKLGEDVLRSVDVTIAAAAMDTLAATPVELVAAPGANKAVIVVGVALRKLAGAYGSVGAGDDMTVKIENAAGATLATVETAGFLDDAGEQFRWVQPTTTAAITPVANKAIVASIGGDIDAAGGAVHARVYYRVVATNF
jgi:hypothetical protein